MRRCQRCQDLENFGWKKSHPKHFAKKSPFLWVIPSTWKPKGCFFPLEKTHQKKSERKNHPLGFRTSSVLKTSERSFLAKILWWEGFWERYPPLGKGSPCIRWRMFWKSNTEYHFGANTKRIMISMCDDSASKIEQTLWIWFHHHENNRCKFPWSLKIRIPFLSRFSSFFSFQAMNFGTFLGCHAARLQVPCLLKYRILLLFHPLSHLDITPKSQQHSPLSLEKSQQKTWLIHTKILRKCSENSRCYILDAYKNLRDPHQWPLIFWRVNSTKAPWSAAWCSREPVETSRWSWWWNSNPTPDILKEAP